MNLDKESKSYKTFLISIFLTITLSISAVFLCFSVRTKQLLNEDILANARAHFNDIVAMRRWNAGYGGVFVEKKDGIESNPYLENPDIRTTDGRIFTMKNPALMTREISEYFKKEDKFSFHITSLNLLNPNNVPDAFESDALKQFEKGIKEKYVTEKINNRTYFRYMAPLFVEKPCLQCHEKQGYEVGDVRGGISVSLDIEDMHRKIKLNTLAIIIFWLITLALLFALVWYFTNKLIKKISDARAQIESMAATDFLTGILNRLKFDEMLTKELNRSKRYNIPLSLVMFDIDHFKNVNDTFGHHIGDVVLKELTAHISKNIRKHDYFARWGGEEFIILLTHTTLEPAVQFAENCRALTEEMKIDGLEGLTCSFGVTELKEDDDIFSFTKRVDKALYNAKNSGRNRVEKL